MKHSSAVLAWTLFSSVAFSSQAFATAARSDGHVETVGEGTTGQIGVPRIGIDGSVVVGHEFAWRVDGGAPNAPVVIIVSPNEANFPLAQFGGTGYVGFPRFTKILTLDSFGSAGGAFGQSALDVSLTGIQVVSQAVVFDGFAVGGLALTSGLRTLFGTPAGIGVGFEQAVQFPHGYSEHVILAELNGDGFVDRLLLNDAEELAFSPGLGNGLYGAMTTQTLALTNPEEIRLHDMDGDGELDYVVTDYSDYTLSVFLGLGGGAFGAELELVLPARPSDLALPDLNNDGVPDAAIISTAGTLLTTLGNGDGTFGAIVVTDPGLATIGLAQRGIGAGDFNSDGDDDVVFALNFPGVLAWLPSDGLGGLGAIQILPTTTNSVTEVSVADVDADGEADLVASTDDGLYVALGDGAGNFAVSHSFAGGRYGVTSVVDQDLDGNLDLIATLSGDPDIGLGVMRGDGTGAFASIEDVSIGYAASVQLADVDQDGDLDFYGLIKGGVVEKRTVGGLFNFGPQNVAPSPGIEINFTTLFGDFDVDGTRDVIVFNNQGSSVQLYTNLDSASPPAPVNLSIPFGGVCGTADLNNDGALDILVSGSFPNYGVNAYLNDGTGSFGPAIYSALAPLAFNCAFGDFNEDGIIDLATRTDDNIGKIWRGTGNGNFIFVSQQGFIFDFGFHILAADFDNDGHLDIGGHSDANDLFQVIFGDGAGGLSLPVDTSVSSSLSKPSVRDETGDGIPDLIYRDAGDLQVRAGVGDGTFAASYTIVVDDSPISWGWVDVTADGLDDLITLRSTVPQMIWIHPSNGDGTYGTSEAFLADVGATMPMVEDLNGDGQLDLVTVNRLGLRVILHK